MTLFKKIRSWAMFTMPAGKNSASEICPTGSVGTAGTDAGSADFSVVDHMKVFAVRGFMRSGTNWANNLCNLHPQVACQGEFHFNQMREGFDRWLAKDWNVPNRFDGTSKAEHSMQRFIKQLMLDSAIANPEFRTKKIKWLGDRSPTALEDRSHDRVPTFMMKRDGRDVIVSWTFLSLALQDAERFKGMPRMLGKFDLVQNDPSHFQSHPHELMDDETWVVHAAKHWASRMRRDYDYREANPEHAVLEVGYEDLHADTESVRMKMYRFLDLDPSLAAPLDSDRWKTSAGLVREDSTSVYRKGRVGEWRKYFTPRCLEVFLNEAGAELERAGYDVNATTLE